MSSDRNFSHYFGAGPAALPLEVKQRFQDAVIQYQDLPISILELSHRSDEFASILDDARSLLKSLYSVPDNYQILFIQGGATLQFDSVPLNLLGKAKHATYIDTGMWSRRAAQFAKKYTRVNLINGLEEVDGKTCCIDPDRWEVASDTAYIYVTPNETVDGIALPEVAQFGVPVVADMTSCFLMRPVDIERYGIVFAATQKTLGISGLTIVIIRNDFLDRVSENTPYLLRYDEHAKQNSIVNTSSVVACYISKLMLEWVERHGGLEQMIQDADTRAELIYTVVDKSELWLNSICDRSRSKINVVFDCKDKKVLEGFLEEAENQGLIGLKGHRLKGGVRASMYSGTPIAAVQQLSRLIEKFN